MTDMADEANGPEGSRPRRVGGTPTGTEVGTTLDERRAAEQDGERPRSPEAPPERVFAPGEAERAEKVVAGWFLLATLAGIGFLVAYWLYPVGTEFRASISTKLLGATLVIALAALTVGIILWLRLLMPDKEMIDERHQEPRSSPEERKEFGDYFIDSAESTQITKRPLLRRTLLLAAVPLGLAPLWLLRDMGPLPKKDMFNTAWRKGRRMVLLGTETEKEPRLLKLTDVSEFGTAISALPEGITDFNAIAKAALLLIRLRPEEIENTKGGRIQKKHSINGVCAFSKICTHAGCPISLYQDETHELLCPCHQSTFDLSNGAEVVFGPAPRPLPQLPIDVDADGYLVAARHYFINGPVGPSFWERGSNAHIREVRAGK